MRCGSGSTGAAWRTGAGSAGSRGRRSRRWPRPDTPHEFVVFVDRPSARGGRASPSGSRRSSSRWPRRRAGRRRRRGGGGSATCSRWAGRWRGSGLDLIYFPASYSFFPVWNVGRVVVTMHDTLALAHPELVFPTWQGRVAWAVKEHAAVAVGRPDLDRLARPPGATCSPGSACPRTGSGSSPRAPTPPSGPSPAGPESDAALARHGIAPGTPVPALRRRPEPAQEPAPADRGVRAGPGPATTSGSSWSATSATSSTPTSPSSARPSRGSGWADRVRFTGFVPDDDLAYLYNRAYALVQPSLMEGFGLPPVEAMACGTPVVCSRAGSLPEVVGEAGVFFDPTDVGAMAAALARPAGATRRCATAWPRRRSRRAAAVHLGRGGPRAARLLRRARPGAGPSEEVGMKFCMLTHVLRVAQLRRRRRVRRPAVAGPGAARARGPRHPLPRRLRDRRAATRPRGPTSPPPGVDDPPAGEPASARSRRWRRTRRAARCSRPARSAACSTRSGPTWSTSTTSR